jgi:cytochrome oxidase Cu insertion factor (SCO1/SenC/PrrC family)
MKRWESVFLALIAAGLVAFSGSFAATANGTSQKEQKEKEKMAHTQLKVGDVAPDFTLLDNQWKPVKLSDFRGKKNVILAFYVLAFTGG